MEQDELERLVREVLGEGYTDLEVTAYSLEEDIHEGKASIVCKLMGVAGDNGRAVEGQGVGMVDALFNGLKATLSEDFPSLDHIYFVDFGITGDFSESKTVSHTDVAGHVTLVVENSSGRRFTFESESKSISASSVGVVVECVEHFVNAETAVRRVYEWIEDARKRARPDLAEKYTQRLADLVQNASYSESLERLRQKVGGLGEQTP
ncbi:MAG: alpha-isopropylmalate synthase regulatory domain-containing protein [Myxococcota bacterium]